MAALSQRRELVLLPRTRNAVGPSESKRGCLILLVALPFKRARAGLRELWLRLRRENDENDERDRQTVAPYAGTGAGGVTRIAVFERTCTAFDRTTHSRG